MEAPLPASALIHSATLICSGVVLFFKAPELICNQAEVSSLLMLWPAVTVCLLSFSAFYNYDIKRILAYSTGSHVSLMLALAVSGSAKLGYLYMLTHASTKVFIFILFGYIIDMTAASRWFSFFFSLALFCLWVRAKVVLLQWRERARGLYSTEST